MSLPISIIVAVLVLTVFLSFAVGIRYAMQSGFTQTRLVMTAFFLFMVCTLSISFWRLTFVTLPYTIPAFCVGILCGYVLGVRTERQKLMMQGIEYYSEHFAHIHLTDFKSFNWWTFVNFYSVMGGLVLINLVGASNVLFHGAQNWAIVTSVVGAFLLGTIVPYLAHLWMIRIKQAMGNTSSVA